MHNLQQYCCSTDTVPQQYYTVRQYYCSIAVELEHFCDENVEVDENMLNEMNSSIVLLSPHYMVIFLYNQTRTL